MTEGGGDAMMTPFTGVRVMLTLHLWLSCGKATKAADTGWDLWLPIVF
jgi:hypothetical protein